MHAWTLLCTACGSELSGPLTEIEVDGDPRVFGDGHDVIPRGCLWRARPGFAQLVAVQPGDLMGRRGDFPDAVEGTNAYGCCGPDGRTGPNLLCGCGVAFATEMGDCWQPHVVAVKPKRVTCVAATARVAVHVYPQAPGHKPSAWEFAAWLHTLLAAEDWYGIEIDRLAREWAARSPEAIVIVWVDPQREEAAGVPVEDLIRGLADVPITVVRASTSDPP